MSPSDLDFGEAWEDPEFVRHFSIRNTGQKSIAIKEMRGGCECTDLTPQSFVLPPGEEQRMTAKIDLTHRFPHQFGIDRRELAVTVHPNFADRGVSASGWTVRGVVKSRVSIDGR